MTRAGMRAERLRPSALLLDLAVVLAFAAAGRASHELSRGTLGVLETAWPFLVGLGAGWLAVLRQPAGRRSWLLDGSVVAVCTLVVGMLLRQVAGHGTALPFVLVATGVLAAGLVGWRGVATVVTGAHGREDREARPVA